jgi:hypothetical protein
VTSTACWTATSTGSSSVSDEAGTREARTSVEKTDACCHLAPGSVPR